MSTALAAQQPAFPTGADFDSMRNAAAIISRSGLVPEAFRGKPEDVMVAILTARGLGLDPMVALQKGYVVKGKFDIEVSVKLGLVLSRVPDFDYEVVVLDDDRAVVEGGRDGKNRVRAEFTYAQAQAAGLTTSKYGDKETWKFYRRDMLLNRALGRVLKLTCAHALYNMPVVLDDLEDSDESPARNGAPAPGTSAAAERSEAVVLEGGEDSGAPPSAPAETNHAAQVAANVALAAKVDAVQAGSLPVPEDWHGRLLRAVSNHYGITPPGTHKNAYAKWVRVAENGKKLGQVVNLYYTENSIEPVKAWVSVPPMDYEKIALWLEARSVKLAGAEEPSPSGGTDAAPAGPPEDEEPAPAPEYEDEKAPTGYQALIESGHLRVTTLLLAMRHATKGERQFVDKSAQSGRYQLKDGDILKECGFTNQHGTPVSQWMDKLQAGVVWDGVAFLEPSVAVWPMTCRAIYDTAVKLNVSTEV